MVTLTPKYVQTVDMSVVEEDLIFQTGSKKALYIKNALKDDVSFSSVGGDLVITFKNQEHTLTLKNYVKLNGKHSYKFIQFDDENGVSTMDIIKDGLVDNQNVIGAPKKGTIVKGTNFNDIINVSEYNVPPKGKKKNKGLTVSAYSGNDNITGSSGNDVISGGYGTNTINVSAEHSFGNDSIKLTKGENLKVVLDIQDKNGTYLEYGLKGKNLIIKVYGEAEKQNLMGTLTIKNYTKKDVITSAGSLAIYDSDGELIQDLRTASFKKKISRTYKGTSVSGSWVNDNIDASDYQLYTNKKRTIENNNTLKKGLKISTGSGNDEIVGSKYSDVIKAGSGNDIINAGSGNDKITGGAGNNTIVLEGKFGNDTVYLTKNENLTLDFTSFGISDTYELKFQIIKNDIKISVPDGSGSIILKNFAKTNVVGENGSVILKFVGKTVDMNKDRFLEFEKDDFSSKGVFIGSRLSETIDATGLNKNSCISAGLGSNTIISTDGNYDKITAGNDGNIVILKSGKKDVTTGSGNDEIYIFGGGEKTIKTGAGTNQINIDNSSDYGKINVIEENVKASNDIIFSNDIQGNYSLTKNNSDLIITTGNSSVNIKEYLANSAKNATTHIYSGGNELTFDDLLNGVEEFNITGKGKLTGTDKTDIIRTTDTKGTKAYNDTIIAGKGNDVINAGKGKNALCFYKGDGNDIVENGGGVDTLVFEKGTKLDFNLDGDILTITYGNNDTITINSYNKNHSVKYVKIGSSTTAIAKHLEPKPDAASNTPSPTDIPAGYTPSELNGYIRGTTGDDILVGTSGDDTIMALGGNDIIYAGAGHDKIFGSGGDDIIYAGKGSDMIYGGAGKNIFYFASGDGCDVIDECKADNTLYFFGLNDVNKLKLNAFYDRNDDVTLEISGYGLSSDKITINSFISSTTYHDYSKYVLQSENNEVSLYEYVRDNAAISDEIRAQISSFISYHASQEGLSEVVQNVNTSDILSSLVLNTSAI